MKINLDLTHLQYNMRVLVKYRDLNLESSFVFSFVSHKHHDYHSSFNKTFNPKHIRAAIIIYLRGPGFSLTDKQKYMVTFFSTSYTYDFPSSTCQGMLRI
jgi:hypothetical protein